MKQVSFELDHITLSGLAFGKEGNPLILATHGWLDNAASFIPMSRFLDQFYIVAIDFAGHGLSDSRAPGSHYHFLDNIYDMHALVEQQGWNDFILLGHSMGGILASVYASAFPDKVSALVTLESFGPLTKEEESSPQQLRDSVLSRLSIEKKTVKHPPSFDIAVQARLAAGKMDESSAELLMKRNVKDVDGQLQWRTDPRLRTLSPLRITEKQAEAFLCGIKCPTLSILGTDGFPELKAAQAKRSRYIEHFHFAECEGGHHFHMDFPKCTADNLMMFFNKVLKMEQLLCE